MKSYPANGSELNIQNLRDLLNSFDSVELKSQIDGNNGVMKVNLDNIDIELLHKHHFFMNAKERQLK